MYIKKTNFKNRQDAAKQLYDVLPIDTMLQEDWTVIATSSGSVPIALEIATKLEARFDYIFTQKLFTKKNSDCELAIITETQDVIVHENILRSFNLDLEKIYKRSAALYKKDILKYKKQYRNGKDIVDLEGKNVLLIDEGLNTGLTMMACIKSIVNQQVKSICVAVPVLPYVTVNDIESIADDLYYVEAPEHFVSIDFYYDDLEAIELEDIHKLRNKFKKKEENVNDM
jgi:putative phosphoribosyl transferase